MDTLTAALSEQRISGRLETDVPLLILGSVIAAIGISALIVQMLRQRSRDRVLLWFGLFAAPYGLRLISSTATFQLAFGQPQRFWIFAGKFVDFAILVPALLLFEEFYGKGWRSVVRRFIWAYVVFFTVAFTQIIIRQNPELVPTAGIGIVFGLPLILVLGRFTRYQHPRIESPGLLLGGLLIFLITFAQDRLAALNVVHLPTETEPYGLFLLICCLGYVAMRRVLENERQLAALSEEMGAARKIQAAILPRSVPRFETLDIAVRYAPMAAVAGDFYDFLLHRPGCAGIVVADVAGHGVPAALVASMVKVAISSQLADCLDAGRILRNLNSTLCQQAQGQYATAVCVYLDESKQEGTMRPRDIRRHCCGNEAQKLCDC
ncbi:MAG: SpoIIE family protein phosphatase [Acidobacteriaceae bacterium]|nr:SpoIIE family protein phosphatase [Acidobacteriaceae bacterium]MBV9780058.1 SpoIIE family protein phosphatase [Acidobacteriaceae bacterium]